MEMLCSSSSGEEAAMGSIIILPPANEWTQRMVGERVLIMPGNNNNSNAATTATSSSNNTTARAMERPPTDHQHHHQQQAAPLKCPRCDSTNTKFCYYNNYSLAQPRHFCKACKRYWTRGGTLRSVPVGGGCRKNKRVKKSSASAAASTPSDQPSLAPPPLSLPIPSQIDLNPMFYPLPSNMGNLNFPALRQNGNISIPCTTYDLQPQLNGLGLGFHPNHHHNSEHYQSGLGANLSHLQNLPAVSSAASLLHDYPIFGSSLSSATASSLLDPRLKQTKEVNEYHALFPYEDLLASVDGNLGMLKDVKIESDSNKAGGDRIDWQLSCQNPLEEMTTAAATATVGPADSSFLYWNSTIGPGGWSDTNYGSSVAPLI